MAAQMRILACLIKVKMPMKNQPIIILFSASTTAGSLFVSGCGETEASDSAFSGGVSY